jgi:hypothetical protein
MKIRQNQNTVRYSNIEIQPSKARYSQVQQDTATHKNTARRIQLERAENITRYNRIIGYTKIQQDLQDTTSCSMIQLGILTQCSNSMKKEESA